MRAKKRRAWSIMEAPLVRKLPNSTQRLEPGSWNSKPGDKSTNSTTETKIGPQSADISLHFPCHQFLQMCVERNIQILYIYMEGESGVRNKDNGLVGRRFKDQVTWIHNRRPICLYHVITLEWSDFGCELWFGALGTPLAWIGYINGLGLIVWGRAQQFNPYLMLALEHYKWGWQWSGFFKYLPLMR